MQGHVATRRKCTLSWKELKTLIEALANIWRVAEVRSSVDVRRGRNVRGKCRNPPGAESTWNAESLRGAEESQKCHKYFLQYVNLLPQELRFEHGGSKLASRPPSAI